MCEYLLPSYWLCSLLEYKLQWSREFNSFPHRSVPRVYHTAWPMVGSWQIFAEYEFKSFQKRKSLWDSRSLGTINICCCSEISNSDWPHIHVSNTRNVYLKVLSRDHFKAQFRHNSVKTTPWFVPTYKPGWWLYMLVGTTWLRHQSLTKVFFYKRFYKRFNWEEIITWIKMNNIEFLSLWYINIYTVNRN